jgi:hypothetical protein
MPLNSTILTSSGITPEPQGNVTNKPPYLNNLFEPKVTQPSGPPKTLEELADENILKGVQNQLKLHNTKGQLETFGYNAGSDSHAFYKRYAAFGQEKMDKIGFSPFKDNDAVFNANTNFLDRAQRSIVHGFAPLFARGFVSGPKSLARMMQGDFGDDPEDAAKYAEAAAIAQDTSGGVGAFFNNSLMNFGYTAGIIGEAITEELAITALTGGVGGFANLPRFGAQIGRGLRGIKGVETITDMTATLGKSLKSLTNLNKAREFFSAAKIESALATRGGKIANFFNPAENLLETGLDIAKNTKQLQGWNRFNNAAFKTAGALYRDVRNINMALSEARLEGGFTRNDTYKQLVKDYKSKHEGKMPPENVQKAMMEQAAQASKDSMIANTLLIFASNKITFGNVMNPKSGLSRMLSKKVAEVQKMAGKTTVREFTKQTLKSGKELLTPKLSTVKGAWNIAKKQGVQKTVKGVIGYTKANLMEGVQEVLQEVIADTSKNYHLQSFYSQPVGHYMYTEAERKAMKDEGFGNILGEAFGKQVSMQGLETFASGFVMGAFASPLNRAIPFVQQKYMQIFKKDEYKAHRDNIDKYVERMTKSVNDTFAKNPLEFLNSKVFSLGTQAELANVIDTGDTKVERDAKEEATIQNVTDLIKMDSLDIWTDYMESLKELTTEEYAEAVGISVEQAQGHVEKLDKVIGRAKEIEKTYKEYNKKFPNPIDLGDYEEGTKEYEKASIYHNAWEQARKNVVFYHENYKDTVARMQKIYQNIGNEELLGKIDPNRVQALLKDDRLKGEIQILESEVQGLKGMTDSASKRKLKQTEATLGILKEYEKDYDNYMDYFYEKGMSKPVVTEAKTETAPEIKADVVQVKNPRKKGYQNSIVKKSESTNESGDKVTEYTAYAVDENGNEKKMTGTGIRTTVGELAPLVKPEKGDSNIFYDEDGNLKYDPNAEIDITKTIEGKEKDGSYQQRITVFGVDVSFQTGAEATFTSNKNIVVGDTSYKSNLTQQTVAETKTEEATPAERETEIKNKLESSFKNYMKALAKQSDDIILDDSIDVAFTSVLDHYDLGREAGKLADAVNALNDPAGFIDHVAKTYDWMYEMWNNREDYIQENISKQLDIIKSNQLLNDMAAIGVYVDLDEFGDYQETGVVPTEFFDAINKRVIKRGSPIYDQVAKRFMELSEFKKVIKESKPVTKNKNDELAKLDAEEAEEISNLPKVPTRIVVRTLDEKDYSAFGVKFITDELTEGQFIDVKYEEEGVEKTATFFKDQDGILRQGSAQGEVVDLESDTRYISGEIFEIINRPTDADIAEVRKKYDALRAELLERLNKYGASASTEAMAKSVEEVKAMLLSDDEYTATRRNYIIKGKAYERMTNRIRQNHNSYNYNDKNIIEDAYDETIGDGSLTEESIKAFISKLKSEEPGGFEDYTYTELEEELKSLMEEPLTETAPTEDIEAKKAEIERRRQEELDKTNAQLEIIEKNGDSFIRVKVEVYTTLSNEETLDEVEIITFKDGSRKFRSRDGKTRELLLDEKIKKENTTTNEQFIESWVGNLDNSLKKISEDNNPNKTAIDKINAKYDAELATLEQAPVRPVQKNIAKIKAEMKKLKVGDTVEVILSGQTTSTGQNKITDFEDYGDGTYRISFESTGIGNMLTDVMVDDEGVIDVRSDEIFAYINFNKPAEAKTLRSIQKELDALNDKIDKLNEQIYDAEDAGNQLRADNLKMRREELYDLLKETSERGKQAVPEIRSDLKNYVVNYAIENTYETAKANGIYLDKQFKAVFDPTSAGPVFDSKYISEEAYNDLFGEDGYITNIKKRADAGEFYIFSTDLIVYTDKAKDADGNPLPPVAGEIDFIFVDREGRKFIVDLKSGKVGKWLNYNDFGSKSYDKKIDNTLQQVGYANLSQLASGDEFQIAIWPVELNYEKTGYINRAGKPSNPNLMLNQKPIGDPKSEPFIINLDKNVKFKMINPEGDGSDVYMTAMEYMEQYVTGPVAPSTKAKAKPKGQAIPQDESSIVDAITNEIQNGNVIKAGMDANMAKTQGTISDASYKYIMGLINEKMNTSLMESAVLAAPGQQFITINDIFAERFDGIISVESKVNAGEIATVESVDEANEEIILVTGYGDRFTVNFNEMNDYIVSPEQLDDKTAPAAPKYEPTQTEIEFTTESMVNVDEFLDDATFRNQATNEADNQSSDEIDNDLYSNLICP